LDGLKGGFGKLPGSPPEFYLALLPFFFFFFFFFFLLPPLLPLLPVQLKETAALTEPIFTRSFLRSFSSVAFSGHFLPADRS